MSALGYARCITDDQTPSALVACSLDASGQRERLDAWRDLLATADHREATPDGVRYLFAASDGLEERVRALAAAEHDCCSFIVFSVSRSEEYVEMTVTTQPDGHDALRFIFAP
jgi:hypothetical protein